MPSLFYDRMGLAGQADLVLILGTSLQVAPFASLPRYVSPGVPRVLFNMERVGGLGTEADDVLELGDCDAGVRKLADALGWREELEAEWRALVGEEEAERQLSGMGQRTEQLQDEVDRLAEAVEEALQLGKTEEANEVDSFARAPAHEGGGQDKKEESKEVAVDGEGVGVDEAVGRKGEDGKVESGQDEKKEEPAGTGGKETESIAPRPAGPESGLV